MKAIVLIVWEDGVPLSQAWPRAESEAAIAAFKKARAEGATAQLFLRLGPGDKHCKSKATAS